MKRIQSLVFLIFLLLVSMPFSVFAWVEGIYLTQYSAQVAKQMKHYIENAKAVGIDTFIIDYSHPSRKYRENIALMKKNNIRYIARIVMFPHGALPSQIVSQQFLEKRYRQIMEAVALGADEIQLDYIRYRKSQRASFQNAQNIYRIIEYVENMLKGKNVKLQIDIFGVAAYGESLHIGQSVPLFAKSLDAICPMVYPSHYEPFRYHAVRPYQTVYSSLMALRRQLKGYPNVKIYAYIELFNYRYPFSKQKKIEYILDQMRAVKDAQVSGWYAWSAKNRYNILFSILGSHAKN